MDTESTVFYTPQLIYVNQSSSFPIYMYTFPIYMYTLPYTYMYTIPYLYTLPYLHMYTIPYQYVYHFLSICISFLILMFTIPYLYLYHSLSICIKPFLIYMYTIPYLYVQHSLSILLLINIYPSLSICINYYLSINILPITLSPFFCSLFGSESKWYTEQTLGVLKGLENIIKRENRDICKKIM